MAISALEKIQEIQTRAEQEIAELRQQAVSEVVRRLAEAKSLVRDLEEQYTQLTGKNLKGEPVAAPKSRPRRAELSNEADLVALLKGAPERKLSRKGINDAGFSLKSALVIAKASPKTFGFEQNGPQGAVWLK
jgi:hypothetical protein